MAAMAALSYGIQSLVGKDIINYHMNELKEDMKKPVEGNEAPEVASAYLGEILGNLNLYVDVIVRNVVAIQ